MSTPASRWIDARISDALAGAFERIDLYASDGYCTEEDVTAALALGWGEGVVDGWLEWIEADDR